MFETNTAVLQMEFSNYHVNTGGVTFNSSNIVIIRVK